MPAPWELVGAAVDLLLGSRCVACAQPGRALCLGCEADMQQLPHVAWPDPRPPELPRPFAVTSYDGPAQAALVAHKERAVMSLARPLGRALALSVMSCLASAPATPAVNGAILLVPPPTSAASVRARGHDPLRRILTSCARSLRTVGIAAEPVDALEFVRQVADQSGLSAASRADNLAGAFRTRRRVRRGLAGRVVVVVDDILTTGATAVEMARALDGSEAGVIGVAVIAATRRRIPAGAVRAVEG